ncbi:MAG: hypothetical protein BGO39_20825 [Chloroflexi bacterium 54-19]|nr:MAG: hypothetical protein BGO39_20825 [Chloroflexi bacterium 54-19]
MLGLEAVFSQNYVPYTKQEYALYLLLKIIPQGNQLVSRLPLNISLVIDNSGSMYGDDHRIYMALEAATQVMRMLGQEDIISVISFADNAQVVLPPTAGSDQLNISRAINSILQMPSGGTCLPMAMQTAAAQLKPYISQWRTNRVLILTDGNTIDEEWCPYLAGIEAANGISFSTFGLGEDWNENLLRAVSDTSGGNWYYIPTPGDINKIFQEELGLLLTTAYNNLRLELKFFQNDTVKEIKIVSPELKDIQYQPGADIRLKEFSLGSVQKDRPLYLLLTLSLVSREPGRYNIALAKLLYDLPGQPQQQVGPQALVVGYVTDPALIYPNGEVLRWVDDAQVDNLVRKATQLAASGDTRKATQLFENARNISDKRGDRKKTQLIIDALDELGVTGQVSRKTQLHTLNQSRKTNIFLDNN